MEAELQAGNQTYIHTYINTKVRTHKDRQTNPTAQPHEPHTISAANADSLQPITVHRAIALKCISVRLWRRHSFCFRQGRTSHLFASYSYTFFRFLGHPRVLRNHVRRSISSTDRRR